MRSVSGVCRRVIVLTWLVSLSACSVYDADAVGRKRSRHGDGGSELVDGQVPDAAPADDAAADGGKILAQVDATTTLGCQPNPDVSNAACPEICPEACNGEDDDCDGKID